MNSFGKSASLLVLLLSMMACLVACEAEYKQEKKIQEIETDGKITNADIVRNPISAEDRLASDQAAELTFDEETFDFGEVDAGEVVEHTFAFTNTGQVPLLVTNARSTCGCTVPKWSETPVEPGKRGEITVRFDTKNKSERQSKPITITANTLPARTQIFLNGYVHEKQNEN